MKNTRSFISSVCAHRPPGAPDRESKALGEIAQCWRNELAPVLAGFGASTGTEFRGSRRIGHRHVRTGRGSVCGLRSFGEGWRQAIASYSARPSIALAGRRPAACPVDARRFQFFLYSIWRHFKPDWHHVRPCTAVSWPLRAVPKRSSPGCFPDALVHRLWGTFLGTANSRGWEIKRKLVWLGTHGFLFRFSYADYLARNPPKDHGHCQHD